ncbi:MAG TPA: MBL fold metallo-hydrolase [Luteibacter sp.]|jgi:hypothetical protein
MATRKATPRRKARKATAGMTVRHYCQGIGDCHLLHFTKDDGSDFYMLIDCGLHSSVTNNTTKIKEIAADIAGVTKNIDVLVATHEHWDHISGFRTANETFKTIRFGEAWLGWTEDPKDKQARKLDNYKTKALKALDAVNSHLAPAKALSPYMQGVKEGISSLRGFYFGAKGDTVRNARNATVALAKKVKYIEPSSKPLTIPGMKNLRIYVLGPPRDEAMIRVTDRASEMYGLSMNRGHAMSAALLNAVANFTTATAPPDDDVIDPFDRNLGEPLSSLLAAGSSSQRGDADSDPRFVDLRRFVAAHYGDAATKGEQDWRRIDFDWTGVGADLAMQLDDRTNNTSVVLAFEFVDTGRVFLFAADAQIGSWLSWQDLRWKVDGEWVTAQDLLKRTVFYKVGHHGSQNATARAKGLELMDSPDLDAFIPTNQKDALKVNWGAMPYKILLKDLEERCRGRVVRADDAWIGTGKVPASLSSGKGSITAAACGKGLWVEFELS